MKTLYICNRCINTIKNINQINYKYFCGDTTNCFLFSIDKDNIKTVNIRDYIINIFNQDFYHIDFNFSPNNKDNSGFYLIFPSSYNQILNDINQIIKKSEYLSLLS